MTPDELTGATTRLPASRDEMGAFIAHPRQSGRRSARAAGPRTGACPSWAKVADLVRKAQEGRRLVPERTAIVLSKLSTGLAH